ncbi:CHAD domain-containing protein [Flaviflagellibacter deserti]|uniref:CHAD domain-containing protein n=1 Tax=Flaviflagellibacter deserti TaxID=2267266 RepID=A0ABV9Z6T9_9HYPH
METAFKSGARHRGADTIEIELRLLASPDVLSQICNAPAVLERARNKGVVRRLVAIYYDTPDRLLMQGGLTLRVRRSGKRYVQTIKCASGSDPMVRAEWETHVATMAPDLSGLPREIAAPFDQFGDDNLVPIFATRVRRHSQALELPDAKIEIAFDEGVIEAGERREPVSEIELELKEGGAGALYELGLSLLEVAPLRLSVHSKAERGYALAFDMPPATLKAGPAGISTEDTVDEAAAKLFANCQHHLMANLAAARSGQSPNGVHQARVALRRLRTAIAILRRELPATSLRALAADARSLARTLGSARNWDVFVTETIAEIDEADLPDVDSGRLRSVAEPFRGRSHAGLQEELEKPQTNRFLLSLGRLIERRNWRDDVASETPAILAEQASVFASRCLARLQRKAIKQGRHFRHLQPEHRHALRLTLKKLRYAVEFFLPLYAEQALARKYLKRLSRLQDALGTDNDVTTTRTLLRDIEGSTAHPDVHRAIGVVIGWQGRCQIDATKRLRRRWRAFKKATPFWAS